jgi:hypothetical protein
MQSSKIGWSVKFGRPLIKDLMYMGQKVRITLMPVNLGLYKSMALKVVESLGYQL